MGYSEFTYHSEITDKCNLETSFILKELPAYCTSYINAKMDSLEPRTRLGYVTNLRIFFRFLIHANPSLGPYIKDISLDDLDNLTADDIVEFLGWLTCYEIDGVKHSNSASGKRRILSALSSFFSYLTRTGKCKNNPILLVDQPKLHKKPIRTLEGDEQSLFIAAVETGGNTSEKALYYHDITALRDKALVYLLIGTGIRVSECVGLDLDDINFDLHRISVIRKGGDMQYVYIGSEVEDALLDYIDNGRMIFKPNSENENALFLSRKHCRMSVRAVEQLVKRYADISLGAKNGITPHKMRSTYASQLYNDTGDIYLVATALNHKSVDTTARSYAKGNDAKLKSAADRTLFS